MWAAHIVGSSTTYATIQAAVDAALAGATITVDAGTYAEKVTVTKSLTINGAQSGVDARLTSRTNGAATGESIVTGTTNSGGKSTAFYVNASDVTIDGFTVQGETDPSLTVGAGIVIAPNRFGTHVVNNIIQNNVTGLFLANNSTTDPAVIQYNVFRSNNVSGTNGGRGIYTNQTIAGTTLTNVTIDSNTFINNLGGNGTTGLEAAISLEATASGRQSNLRITNNTMTGNGKAMLVYNASGLLIQGNIITATQDQYSGTLRFEGNVQNVNIQYNNIYNNTGPAVAVDSKATPGDSSGFVANFNNFYGNNGAYAVPISVVFEAARYTGAFDARNNFWGSSTGPSGNGPGTGDAASAGVFQTGTGLGWALTAGGSLLYSPWSTTMVAQPGVIPAAPIGVTAVASGLTEVTINWTDAGAVGSTAGFAIQRSSDGVNFAQVATTLAGVTRFVDLTVSAGTTYTYRIAATNSNGSSAFSVVASDTTPAVGSSSVKFSTINWVSATTDYGSVTRNLSVAGNPLTIGTVTYGTGIGTHAVSNIVYNLAGAYSNFMADIGVDAEVNSKGTGHIIFRVVGDGKTLYDSGVLLNRMAPVSINVDVTGVTTLTLIATNGVSGIDYDHADWAAAELISAPLGAALPVSPSGLVAAAASSSQVNLSWTNNAPSATSFVIERSTDGLTFAQIGTVTGTVQAYSDQAVGGGTSYTYRVAAVNVNGASTFSPVAVVTTPAAGSITTYLSDLNWASATTGYGTVRKNLSIAGNPIQVSGVTYAKGIGTHAVSNIVYNLGGGYTNFLCDIGVDSEVLTKGTASINFKVLGDNGVVLYQSGNLTNSSATLSINVNVTGVQTMTLVATNGIAGSIDYDHADWAGARLLSSASQPPAAPTNLVAVASSTTQVNLNWTNTAPTATGFIVQRAVGTTGTYTQVGTTAAGVTTFFDKTAAAGTNYAYQVIAINGASPSPASNTATATTLSASAIVTNLSNLTWTSATTGYGTIRKNLSVSGNAITLRGVTYATGIGAHAVSTISYNLAGGYTNFVSDVGVDDEVNGKGVGSVVFQVYGDGQLLFDSGTVTNAGPIVSLNVAVAGVQTLTLVATSAIPNNIDYAHADWAGARLVV
ncbi:MAG: hypothetical protein JWM57_1338 [Phycisphaerales bacterium]|nr:hypothetical protein [Phycisphaerales bacterium]